MQPWELDWYVVIGRLLLAAALGGLLGLEREYDGQDAGFRTHLLVALGGALFSVVSVSGFNEFVTERAETNVAVDVTRIAAYVAPGIGFIGGGAILKYGGRVSGITTAASLWSAAAIGVASGLGSWLAALTAAVVVVVALEVLQPVGRLVHRAGRRRRAAVSLRLADHADLAAVLAVVQRHAEDQIHELRFGVGPEDSRQLTIELWSSPGVGQFDQLVTDLVDLDGVLGLGEDSNA